jgi:flagellar L-ring protein precursor FlgH
MKSLTAIAACMSATLTLSACVSHIAPYAAKHRKFDAGKYGTHGDSGAGSLYAGNTGLFEDSIASRIGDIIVIKIDENDSATHAANTTLNKNDDTSYGMPAALGLLQALQKKYPNVDATKLLETTVSQAFTGSGSIARQGQVSATLPVRVADVMPNGDFYVEGTKTVMVGDEEHQIYMSGIVRRVDLDEDDSVLSSRISDAEVEYTGRGDIQDTQRRGWLSRVISKLWPF